MPRPFPARAIRCSAVALTALALVFTGSAHPISAAAQSPAYAGWVMDAYPQLSQASFQDTFRRMRTAGANFVWIGHNNPVDVNPDAWEVALSYAVFAAATDPADPQHEAALYIAEGQRRALRAARATGLPVVLPIGYRTQMGPRWSASHPGHLRLASDGQPISVDGPDASPYSEQFRADTQRYYAWIQREFVVPFRDVVLMVMLSNEPTGVDYSPHADAVFRSRNGFGFADVGGDYDRAARLGEFQAKVMVDYARWAAEEWLALDPRVTVSIAFDGGVARKNMQAPIVEATFRDMPPNFQPAWDLNLRNGGPADSLNDSEVTSFAILSGSLAYYSARHQRPYWLWTSGNSWGLGQASSDPSTIADAIVNLRAAANLARQNGGLLRGIAVWAYNVRGQGLYNDRYRPSYNPDTLFSRLSAQFWPVRQILEGPRGSGPDAIVIAPNAMAWRQLGENRVSHIWSYRSYNFGDLVSLARSGASIAVVDNLDGVDLAGARIVVSLARESRDLPETTQRLLREYRKGGGVVVSTDEISGVNGFDAQYRWQGVAPELYFADVTTSKLAGPVEALGFPRLHNSFVFPGPGELIAYGGTAYDAAEIMRAYVRLPAPTIAIYFSRDGVAEMEGPVAEGLSAVQTQRRAFAIIPRP